MAAGRGCEPNFPAIFIYFNISFVQSVVCNALHWLDRNILVERPLPGPQIILT